MQILERGQPARRRLGSTTRPLTPCFTKYSGFAGIETRHDRLSRVERLDHDQPVVFLHGHERHRNSARKQIDQLLVTDAPQELNPAVVAGQRAESAVRLRRSRRS